MDQDQNTSLFGLSIDQTSKSYLSEAAKWAKFLAIAGFIGLGLMVVYGIYISLVLSTAMQEFEDGFGGGYSTRGLGSTFGTGVIIIYIIIAVIAFFPLLFLLRFSKKMKTALDSNEQEILNDSFRNLKVYYQYVGVLTIIGLVLMLLSLLTAIMAGSMASGM